MDLSENMPRTAVREQVLTLYDVNLRLAHDILVDEFGKVGIDDLTKDRRLYGNDERKNNQIYVTKAVDPKRALSNGFGRLIEIEDEKKRLGYIRSEQDSEGRAITRGGRLVYRSARHYLTLLSVEPYISQIVTPHPQLAAQKPQSDLQQLALPI